eukprot:6209130-Pleurochrysis_carterae.AAC.1
MSLCMEHMPSRTFQNISDYYGVCKGNKVVAFTPRTSGTLRLGQAVIAARCCHMRCDDGREMRAPARAMLFA